MSEIFRPPFIEQNIGKFIGEGAESKVHEFGSDFVLKEPNEERFAQKIRENFEPVDEEDAEKFHGLMEYMASEEHFRQSKEDYEKLKGIFGEMLVDTMYVIGEPREGNKIGHYIFQRRIEGCTWEEFSTSLTKKQRESFLEEHKDEFITLIGGARKVLVETGGLIDLWAGNVIVDTGAGEGNERLAIIDPGSPMELNKFIEGKFSVPKNLQLTMTKRVQKMISDLDTYLRNLELTPEEHARMNSLFNMTDEDFENAKRKLSEKCETILQK